MLVHGRPVVEQREHAGGDVGTGDRVGPWQVAVDRGAVGSRGWLVGQPGRADDRPVQVVQAMAGESRVKLFFDKETGLLTRVLRYSKTLVGSVPVEIDYSDYREVAGVKIPFQWRLTWTDGQSMFSLDDVKPNVAIDPAKFAKPVAAANPVVAPAKVAR